MPEAVRGNQLVDVSGVLVRDPGVVNDENVFSILCCAMRQVEAAREDAIVTDDDFVMHEIVFAVWTVWYLGFVGEMFSHF